MKIVELGKVNQSGLANVNHSDSQTDLVINDVVVASMKEPVKKKEVDEEIVFPESGVEALPKNMNFELNESLFLEAFPVDEVDIFDYLIDRFGEEGFDVTTEEVKQYAQAVADYIRYALDFDPDYDFDRWYQDTLENYPEELAMLPKAPMYEGLVEATATKSVWDKIYDNIVADPNIDDRKLTFNIKDKMKYDADNIKVDGNGNLIAYAATEDGLALAKKLADHFGLQTRVVEENYIKDPSQAWSIKIYVPEEMQ